MTIRRRPGPFTSLAYDLPTDEETLLRIEKALRARESGMGHRPGRQAEQLQRAATRRCNDS